MIKLTPGEHEVLSYAAQGLNAKTIAVKREGSKRTVDFHLSNIYDKLGVGNRTAAVVKAMQLKLI